MDFFGPVLVALLVEIDAGREVGWNLERGVATWRSRYRSPRGRRRRGHRDDRCRTEETAA
ncbi:hypothetical protein [Rhodococcus sovatensis]|uniref:Uncharacterized protein n=1 Tax=Rhodococcus sovatensis TaxID=1805840 RepID=A0ABZ2PS31_9NOCA